jgi:hypothetical protein
MKAYYDRRAFEYDDWWLGQGLYADRDRPGWAEELDVLAGVIASLPHEHSTSRAAPAS